MLNELPQLRDRLKRFRRFAHGGHDWAIAGAELMGTEILSNLAKQGRTASHPPPLSDATRRIYAYNGPPDGSGIRNHIEYIVDRSGASSTAVVGIPRGRPSMVAQVQDRGATIRVTDRMRGYLAVRGIHLRQSTQVIRIPARYFWRRAWADTHSYQQRQFGKLEAPIKRR